MRLVVVSETMKKLIQVISILFMAIISIKTCQRTMEVRSWPKTSAIISSYSVEDYFEDKTNTDGSVKPGFDIEHRLWISYEFQLDGVLYSGRFNKDDLDDARQIEQQQRIYPLGKKIIVRYDPQNPADSEYKGF
jgi:hypothetical protein